MPYQTKQRLSRWDTSEKEKKRSSERVTERCKGFRLTERTIHWEGRDVRFEGREISNLYYLGFWLERGTEMLSGSEWERERGDAATEIEWGRCYDWNKDRRGKEKNNRLRNMTEMQNRFNRGSVNSVMNSTNELYLQTVATNFATDERRRKRGDWLQMGCRSE